MSRAFMNTSTTLKQLGLEQCASGVVVNLYFLSGVGMCSTGSNMTFHEQTTALGSGLPDFFQSLQPKLDKNSHFGHFY